MSCVVLDDDDDGAYCYLYILMVVVVIVVVFGTKPDGTRTSESVYKVRRSLSLSKSTRVFYPKYGLIVKGQKKDLCLTP